MKERIIRGIEYFRNVQPTKWNPAHVCHLKVFLDLVEEYVKRGDVVQIARKEFGVEN